MIISSKFDYKLSWLLMKIKVIDQEKCYNSVTLLQSSFGKNRKLG